MPEFTCRTCGSTFDVAPSILDRYPGWKPSQCLDCRDTAKPRVGTPSNPALALDESDPQTGVFTDGSSVPNPGPGGWGAVYVVDGEIVAEASGFGGVTTNNRMELTALIEAAALVPPETSVPVYSDSNLAVRTITEWAAGWEKRGWKRKSGPVENLDLVQKAYRVYRSRPELSLKWIKAHVGFTWNEYADELANRARETGT